MSDLSNALDFYAKHGAALFPIQRGQKTPFGIVGSFKHDHSIDRKQWQKWVIENPGLNFGVVAFASNWIICDIDTSGGEAGRAEAQVLWADLCASWGLPGPLPFHVESQSGGFHVYFQVLAGVDASQLRQPDAIKKRINIRCVGYTVVAGSQFEGRPYRLLTDAPPHPAPDALVRHCTRSAPRKMDGASLPGAHDASDVAALLTWMAARGMFEAYEDWVSAGMALKASFGSDGFSLWDLTHDGSVSPDHAASKWESFASSPTTDSVTLLSLMHRAHAAGWTGVVRRSTSAMFDGVAQLAAAAGASLSSQAPPLPYGISPPPIAPVEYLLSSGAFVRGFVPPDYLLDGILQKGFLYSLTAQTGVGKTTIAMLVTAHVSIGRMLGGLDVAKGPVIYFAGENPTDVRMRWLGLTRAMNIDPDTADVHFIDGVVPLSQTAESISKEIRRKGLTPSLVIVDTAAAFNEGDEENSNNQAGDYARRLRSLTKLPGGPCVLVLCHPAKNAGDDALVPRGGGAFLNEVDGNIALRKLDGLVAACAFGKFRGPEFPPLSFELVTERDHPKLKDARGRPIPTVIARSIGADDTLRIERAGRADGDAVLKLLCDRPGISPTDVARALNWKLRATNGKEPAIHHIKAARVLKRMEKEKLVEERRGGWHATQKGQKDINVSALRPDEQS
jgi:hypothetical protein